MDKCVSDPKKIIMELRVNRGHASAQRLKRESVDSGGGNMHLANCAAEVLEQYEASRPFDRGPHVS